MFGVMVLLMITWRETGNYTLVGDAVVLLEQLEGVSALLKGTTEIPGAAWGGTCLAGPQGHGIGLKHKQFWTPQLAASLGNQFGKPQWATVLHVHTWGVIISPNTKTRVSIGQIQVGPSLFHSIYETFCNRISPRSPLVFARHNGTHLVQKVDSSLPKSTWMIINDDGVMVWVPAWWWWCDGLGSIMVMVVWWFCVNISHRDVIDLT